MQTHYVLVDFENVQPRNVGVLRGGPFRIKVFLGASQAKVSLEMAQALQSFGPDAEYIQITGNGSNALDFHIAYYIGELSAKHPDAVFHVISKDTGFDPLLKHLKARGIECKRSVAITDIPHVKAMAPTATKSVPTTKAVSAPTAKVAPTKKTVAPAKKTASKTSAVPAAAKPAVVDAVQAHYQAALDNLRRRKSARPSTIKTLASTIQNLHKPPLPEDQLKAIIDRLVARGNIKITGSKVSYALA